MVYEFIKKNLLLHIHVLLIYKNISKFNYQQNIICLNNTCVIKTHFLKYLTEPFFYEIHYYTFALNRIMTINTCKQDFAIRP